ncbi:hypothetical protein BAY61_03110 [Prauserella marina]|nr:hypothetical protein BAY61_03110 [Prauserella marina]
MLAVPALALRHSDHLLSGQHLTQPREGTMLGDSDRARGRAHGFSGLFRGKADNHPQHHDLALFIRQNLQKLRHPLVQLALQGALFGADAAFHLIGNFGNGLRPVPGRSSMRVSHLVLSDSIYESQERAPLITVRGQCREHRETHLLGNVVC